MILITILKICGVIITISLTALIVTVVLCAIITFLSEISEDED